MTVCPVTSLLQNGSSWIRYQLPLLNVQLFVWPSSKIRKWFPIEVPQKKIKIGVPQGSVLGSLPFNVLLNDLCLINLDYGICNFADDNTLYSCSYNLQEIVTNVENGLIKLLEWLKSNWTVANSKQFQLMLLGSNGTKRLRLNIEEN